MYIHEDRVAGGHPAFDKIGPPAISHLVELAEPSDFSRGDPFFTALSFGLLVVALRHTFFVQDLRLFKLERLAPTRDDGGVQVMGFGETQGIAMGFGDIPKGLLGLCALLELFTDHVHLGGWGEDFLPSRMA
jgi:hypothetical protein